MQFLESKTALEIWGKLVESRMGGAEDIAVAALIVAVWVLAAPKACALITTDIIDEKIFTRFTAWIDRNYRGTLIGYLFRCRRCLSHWICVTLWMFYIPAWMCVGIPYVALVPTVFMLLMWAISSSHDIMKEAEDGH